MRGKLALWLLIALLLAATVYSGYALYQRIEFYDDTTDMGPTAAALRNPFLAAQQYLQQSGRAASSGADLEQLQHFAADGTLIIEDAAHILNETRVEALLQWVEHGGQLIVGTQVYDDEENDWLLNYFAVEKYLTQYQRDPKAPCGCETDSEAADLPLKKMSELMREANKQTKEGIKPPEVKSVRARQYPAEELAQLQFGEDGAPVTVHFSPFTALTQPHFEDEPDPDLAAESPPPLYWGGSSVGPQLVQFEYGDGLVTIVSDIGIWESERIGEYDHAHLLDLLSAPQRPVYLLYGAQMPGLTTLLWRHGRELLSAGALWLCAWLLYRGRRFGPVREQAQPARRSLAEHIQASAAYLWRRGAGAELLRGARTAVQRRAQQVLPGYTAQSPAQQLDALSQHTGLNRNSIERALHAEPGTEPEVLRDLVTTLQNIGRKL